MVWRLKFFASALGFLPVYLEVKIVTFVKSQSVWHSIVQLWNEVIG